MSDDSPVEQALAGGAPQRFGWYRFHFGDERWEWSPEVARIHGYEPGTVTPTTRLVLSHKHPDDYEQVAATLAGIRRTLKPFSTRAAIEQAKGILMLVYRIQPDAAFDLLRWRSQETNVKLRVLAEQLLDDVSALEYSETVPPRGIFDRLLLTLHQRVRAKVARRREQSCK